MIQNMKKIAVSLLGALSLFIHVGCDSGIAIDDAVALNGYWQIESVRLEDGTLKDFRFSPLVDYIELNGNQGVRKKVTPKLDGTFEVTRSSEAFTLIIENDSLKMLYETPYSNWQETIIAIAPGRIKILNREGKIYTYKTYEKIDLTN